MSSTFPDFGRYLTQQRSLRGLTREDVVKATRMSLALVAALEDGVPERLPERVFVVNHVRSYAAAVGLSPDEAVNRFHEIPGTLAPTEQSPVVMEAARRKSAWIVVAVIGAAVTIGFLVLYVWTKYEIAANLGR